ncbi:glucokinase [Raineyella antarctica]|uniref:Glucokinase n=1 Tax=Raineyella antarctica TaxID=1577474 RepID=A0A1G6GE80_9ACTN|nr:ROK family glucokinase [Raineyella antarctica]SDB80133.1 glucokinase [Raineyella antarctica]
MPAADRPFAIGIDIGGSKVAAGVVTSSGELVDRRTLPTPTDRADAVEGAIVRLVADLSADHPVTAVGIGAAGWVDETRRIVRFSPHLAWRNEPLADRLAARLELPVVIDNDANAAAWGEYRFGAGQGCDTFAMITLGTGIGGGLVIDGEVHRGRWGVAGEWGHLCMVPDGQICPCGNRGCWEQYCSGEALRREARALAGTGSPMAVPLLELVGNDPEAIRGHHVTTAALNGDPACLEILCGVGEWLGRGLAGLAAILDPARFVIGGGVSEAGEVLLAPARTAFARHLTGRGFRPLAEVVAARLGNDAGLVGAADLARRAAQEPSPRA